MPFPWMAAATLGAGGLAFLGAKSANRASARSAREQMEFQENMSNTSYQRVMADMRAASLNPILAGKLGGASAPPGASMRRRMRLLLPLVQLLILLELKLKLRI